MAYKYFYSAAASGDPCTLYSDRNLINRRNVTMPVDNSYASCKKFLMLEVETRVTCMAMQVLGMTKLSDTPTTNIPPKHDAPGILKKIYLGRVSNMIYENYISEQGDGTQIMKGVLEKQELDAYCKKANRLMKMEGTLVDLYHAIKHLPTMENEEEITKLRMFLLLISLHRP